MTQKQRANTGLTLVAILSVMVAVLAALAWPLSGADAGGPVIAFEDLPAGAVLLSAEIEDPSHPTHPLGGSDNSNLTARVAANQRGLLQDYQEVSSLTALFPTDGVAVVSFTYKFRSAAGAQVAIQALDDSIQADARTSFVKGWQGDRINGSEFLLTGSEKDTIVWFVGQRGNSVLLVMANGMTKSSVIRVFEQVMSRIILK